MGDKSGTGQPRWMVVMLLVIIGCASACGTYRREAARVTSPGSTVAPGMGTEHGSSVRFDHPATAHPDTLSELEAVFAGVAAHADSVGPGRPLLIDVASFVAATRSITGSRAFDQTGVGRAIRKQFKDLPLDQAILRNGEYQFRMVDNGVHVRMDSLQPTPNGYRAVATYHAPYERNGVVALDFSQVALDFVRVEAGMRFFRVELRQSS